MDITVALTNISKLKKELEYSGGFVAINTNHP